VRGMTGPFTSADVGLFIAANAIPNGYMYTLVRISFDKRLLQAKLPTGTQLEILEGLEISDHHWLTPKMVTAIQPMCDKAMQIASEAGKLGPGKMLDVFAQHFRTFAVLNPSLIAALEMMPAVKLMTALEAAT
jgi:hypothetical protein